MALIPTLNPGLAGAVPAPVAVSGGGDTCNPGTRLHILNGGAGVTTVTIVTPGTVRGLAIADQTVSVTNGSGIAGCKSIDLPADLYADPADGLVHFSCSPTTSVTAWVEGPVTS